MPSLDHVVIAVPERERFNAFYRDVVRAELVDTGQGSWRYRSGDQQLNVHGPGSDPQPVAACPVTPETTTEACSSSWSTPDASESATLATCSRG